jgi:hypothetical protein
MRWVWLFGLLCWSCAPKPKSALRLKEVSFAQLHQALKDTTVERRLSNLLELFSEGNYASTPTLMALTGIPTYQHDERDDQTQLRQLIEKIAQITRVGDSFVIRLHTQTDLREKLYVYGQNQGSYKRHEWEIFISRNAKITVKPTRNGIKVNSKGIRVGYSLLKLDIPSLYLRGNYATILGIKVDLSR